MARFIKIYVERNINDQALRNALSKEVRGALASEGKILGQEVRKRMRRDLGGERASVKRKVTGRSGFFQLAVWSTAIQALVDEYGRRAGAKMPPWRAGSLLFSWVVRHGLVEAILGKRKPRKANAVQGPGFWEQGASYVVARSIARRGIKARKPFEKAMDARRGFIVANVKAAIGRAIEGWNSG